MDAFQNSYWFGMGTLKALLDDLTLHEPTLFVEMDGSLPAAIRLRGADDPEAAKAPEPAPVAETPEAAAAPEPDPEPDIPPEVARLMEDINVLVGAPKLSPDDYDALFDGLAMALAGGAVDRDQLLQETGANLPDGAKVRRGEASFVISSLADEGVLSRDDAPRLGAERLAEHFRDIVLSAVDHTQRSLDADERRMLDHWLVGEEPSDASDIGDEDDDDAVDDDASGDHISDGDALEDEANGAEDPDSDAGEDDQDDDDDSDDDSDDDGDDDDFEDEAEGQFDNSDGDDDSGVTPRSGEAPKDGLRLPWDRRWRDR
jgi:hypothetical protein